MMVIAPQEAKGNGKGRNDLIRHLLVLVLLVPLVAVADDMQEKDRTMEDALHEVLVHGDLSDIDFLSKTLGLNLKLVSAEVKPLSSDDPQTIRAIPTAIPPYLFASYLYYDATVNAKKGTTWVSLMFMSRPCPDIDRWAADWKQKVTEGVVMDAPGFTAQIRWQGREGITLDFTYMGDRSYCQGRLSQQKLTAVSFPKLHKRARIPGRVFVERVIDIVSAGDLRDYRRTARILHTDLIPVGTVRRGLLYQGGALLGRVIPGSNPGPFMYDVDDTGWVSPPSFVQQPRHLAARIVSLWLPLDTDTLCIPERDIEAELRRRSIDYRLEVSQDIAFLRTIQGGNMISIGYSLSGPCIEMFILNQTTDVFHKLETPTAFYVATSLDAQTSLLSLSTLDTIDAMVDRIKKVPIGEVDVAECGVGTAPDSEKKSVTLLAHQIETAFVERGIQGTHIHTYHGRAARDAAVQCSTLSDTSGAASYVSVDVVIE
jgi:hypothetical protein